MVATPTVLVTARTVAVVILFLFLSTLETVQFLDLLPGHPKMAFAPSEPPGTPVEDSPPPFEVNDDLGTVDLAIVGRFVCSYEVFLGVEFNKAVPSGFTLEIPDDLDRFDNTVFLQMRWHLPRIRNSDSFR